MIYFIEVILVLSIFYDLILFMAASGQGGSSLPRSARDTRKCSVLAT